MGCPFKGVLFKEGYGGVPILGNTHAGGCSDSWVLYMTERKDFFLRMLRREDATSLHTCSLLCGISLWV